MLKAAKQSDDQNMPFKRTKALSVPQLKLTANSTVYVRIDQPIREITLSSTDDKGEHDKCNAVTVVDLTDGEIKQLLLDKIPNDLFLDLGDALVGKAFEITKGAKVQSGKNGYHPYTIYEIEA